MSETAWAHLPNAAVIDEMLADVKARPKVWEAAWGELWADVWSTRRIASWSEARYASSHMAKSVGRAQPGRAQPWRAAYSAETTSAARGATFALIAWDSSADLLALTPDALRTIIDTCDGDVKHQAVLLLPAVIARSTP